MSQSGRRPGPKSDSTALALMVGMILVVAVTGAASFSAAGSGALQETLRALGFGRETEMQAEQRRQATTLSDLERIVNRMDKEIGGLTTRMGNAESSETATAERVGTIDGGLTAIANDVKDLRARTESAANDAWRKPVDHLNAAVTGTRTDIINLRSSLDASDEKQRNAMGTLNRRVERLEQALIARDATSSISPPPSQYAPERPPSDNRLMNLFGLRGSAGEAQSGHVIDMGGGH